VRRAAIDILHDPSSGVRSAGTARNMCATLLTLRYLRDYLRIFKELSDS
jgi:hypothetical protein